MPDSPSTDDAIEFFGRRPLEAASTTDGLRNTHDLFFFTDSSLAGGLNSPGEIVFFAVSLIACFVTAMLLRAHYMRFQERRPGWPDTANVLPFIATVVMIIITVIKSSLALSLGLVGAMSIVRFRTPIKSPADLAYIFLAIAVGIGFGAGYMVQAVIGASIILLGMSMVYMLRRKDAPHGGMEVYSRSSDGSPPDGGALTAWQTVLHECFSTVEMLRMSDSGTHVETVYRLGDPRRPDALEMLQRAGREHGLAYTLVTRE